MSTNPYTAPKAPVADPERSLQGNFVAGGVTSVSWPKTPRWDSYLLDAA